MNKIIWETYYCEKSGLAIQNLLNDGNMQPGKFVIVESEFADRYKILAVKSEIDPDADRIKWYAENEMVDTDTTLEGGKR